jgi:predicted ATPase with chaperone activity
VSVCHYPCPCGYYGDPERERSCSLGMVQRYQKRISGPLMDRFDSPAVPSAVALVQLSHGKRTRTRPPDV